MTEKKVKDALDFLCTEYGMEYALVEFKKYLSTNATLKTYNYYNNYGCFTISNLEARGEVDYVRLDNITLLADYVSLSSIEKQKYNIDITSIEKEIWNKYNTFWLTDRKILRILSEVINKQIEESGEFFGIKVNKKDS